MDVHSYLKRMIFFGVISGRIYSQLEMPVAFTGTLAERKGGRLQLDIENPQVGQTEMHVTK